ncbi:serine/threonine-protein kinase [Streptomyces tsukubensis]|uniref:serine/threonine-protein kinase n=1 Tax=Streptomyces tsukubensis TaxID=83656 RepID=UPI0019624C12|nr:serine/threonine-protein kinase [Streptomyces tsukubensis]
MAESRLIHDRYRLEEVIGRGGMGEVWRAVDESLGRSVAVKCLKPVGPHHDASFSTVLRERFRREARVAAALQHRGVTVVHDFGEYEGVLFLVMELLDGRNLSQLLEENAHEPLPVDDVVEIAVQVADALAYTHERGIVHRDLKPANIVRLTDGTVKICDFGIARLGENIGTSSRLTGTGIAMGTPHYMSPEQIGGGHIDHRSDLYSLGCVLYEIATGVPPFDDEDAWAVLIGHRDTVPQPLRVHRPEIPEHVQQTVLDLLAKTPDGRPADARDLRLRMTGPRGLPAAPAPSAARPAAPAPLPAWGRRLTGGHHATATALRPVLPDHTAGLTGEWTTGTAVRPALAGQTVRRERPTPSPEALAVLAGRHSAGLSLGRLGRWEEAGEVHRAVAAEREHALGADHPDTLASRYEVAFTLSRTGRAEDALDGFRRVADGRERALGADHPDTLAARYEVGISLGRLGRAAEAVDLYTALIADRTRLSGPDDPETLRARHGLGVNLGRTGRWPEALEQARDISTRRARTLGPDHPDTLVSHREVAVALGWLARWPEALTVYTSVAGTRDRVLGPDHPDALASRNDEAHCLEQLGRHEEAVELYRRVAALRDRRAH